MNLMMNEMPSRRKRVTVKEKNASLPVWAVATSIVSFVVLAKLGHDPISITNAYDVFQNFANYGWVTLAIALSMISGEFDLSVPSMFALGGTVAVLTGANPFVGLAFAALVGLGVGFVQGLIVAKMKMSSVPVTLGGYLIMYGLTTALTHDSSVAYGNLRVGARLQQPVLGIFSVQSIVVIAAVVAIGMLLRITRFGAEVRSLGSDRRAATVAGVRVDLLLMGLFAIGAIGTSLTGALLDYTLATASSDVQLTPLVFAVTAAVLGGVSIDGGKGTILGISMGVLALSVVQEGLAVTSASSDVSNIVTGALLMIVALIVAPDLHRRLNREAEFMTE